ncbi:MAG TPA: hypothetical protein VGC13_22535 [Longimicrobium sp.]|jgi:hypothetical protein|uniref:hypothetical protein n=1 Tax=Longimicrobium sp. TaxID=2029185 RepID=UPI002EDB62A4
MPEISFSRPNGRDLYTASGDGTPDGARPRYLLRLPDPAAPDTLTLSATWSDPAARDGYYLFLDAPLAPEQEGPLAQFIRNRALPGFTRFVWVARSDTRIPRVAAMAGVREGAVAQPARISLGSLSLEVQAGCTAALAPGLDGFELAPAGGAGILFRAAPLPDPLPILRSGLRIALAGPLAGAPAFAAEMDRGQLLALGGDVRYFHGPPTAPVRTRYPVFLPPAAPATLDFDAALDPLRPEDASRSRFAFGARARGAELEGCFSTPTGRRLRLRPRDGAALALCREPRADAYYLAPSGDFGLVDPAGRTVPAVMCGLQATEYLAPTASALRFVPGMPAYAPRFPAPPESGDLAPALDDTATTAWMQPIDQAAPSGYFAQPRQAVYFGHPNAAAPRMMDVVPVRVGEYGRDAFSLPAAPYGGVAQAVDGAPLNPGVDAAALAAFERDVLAPTRWRIAPFLREGPRFGEAAGEVALLGAGARRPMALSAVGSGLPTALTPQGFLATLNEDGSWRELVLAHGPGGKGRLAFTPAPGGRTLAPPLALALLSGDVFLVISRAAPGTTGSFDASVTMGGFTLSMAPAAPRAPLESILLFKFRDGALRDLVEDVNLWTSPDPFNDKEGDGFPVQDTIRRFLDAARESDDPNLRDFDQRIARNPAWRGVLALNAGVTGLRTELEGLRGRMTRPLRGHHLGIEMNQVRTEPAAEIVTSSLFGLILYPPVVEAPPAARRARVPALRLHTAVADEAATAADALRARAKRLRSTEDREGAGEAPPPDQDFAVRELTVLFRNSEVVEFRCRVELEINRLFGRDVERVGGGGNRIPLLGSFQQREGVGGFALEAREPARFRFPAPEGMVRILGDVAVEGAEFVTAGSEPADGKTRVTARFALTGGLGFAKHALPLDLFGYGGDGGAALLPFTGLSLDYDFLRDGEGNVSEPGPLRFNPAGMAFLAPPEGSLRAGSLPAGMPLRLRGFRWAADGLSAPGLGAQAVQVPALTAQEGEDGGPSPAGRLTEAPRYALEMGMPLGTLGSLATAGASLDAGVVLGWGPGDTVPQDDAAAVWVKLPALTPGVAGYSFQGVLKTTFGDGNLMRFPRGGRGVYALLFNNVALTLFGITLPPGVVLDFVLFADPGEGAAAGKSNLGWYLGYVPKEDG